MEKVKTFRNLQTLEQQLKYQGVNQSDYTVHGAQKHSTATLEKLKTPIKTFWAPPHPH